MEYWTVRRSIASASALGSRYILLPGLAQFDETIIDKFEAAGIKILRNRVTTLRAWLQLWDSRTGHIVWESSGEVTTAAVFLSPKQTVALEQIAKKLLVRMMQDGLLNRKPKCNLMKFIELRDGRYEPTGSWATGPA